MKYLIIDIWDSKESKDLAFERLKTEQFDKVILFCQHEWKYWADIGSHTFTEFVDELAKQNKTLYTTTLSFKIFQKIPEYENVNVEAWPTYWFIKTYLGLNDPFTRKRKNYKIDVDKLTYKQHFISMNRRAHPWRCEIIDLLAKYNLIDDNAISWFVGDIMHPFKYFKRRKLILDEEYQSTFEQYELPNQYYETFAQLVVESTDETEAMLISEKTATPLLVGKPFLVATAPGHHAFLKQLGFQMYDEIFDYSFDEIQDQPTRFEMLVDNFKRLSEIPITELHKLNDKIKDKIIYNRTLAENIVFDRSYYPKVALEIVETYESTGEEIEKWMVSITQGLKRLK
jgi:hypothetical protein